jgi:signal transduction histidine kinase
VSRRLLASYLLLTLGLLAALEIPLAVNHSNSLRSQLTSSLERDALTMAAYVQDTVQGKGSVDLWRLTAGYAARSGGRVVIVDGTGATLADSEPNNTSDSFETRPEIAQALAGKVASGTRRSDTLNTRLLYVAVPIATASGVKGALRITYSTGQIEQRRRAYILALVGIAAISLAFAALLGLILAGWFSRPLRRLKQAAAALGEGDLSARAAERSGPPEMRELAHAFDLMAVRIDGLVSSQQAFVADASHQLRSPLAALQLRLENLQAELTAGANGTDPALPGEPGEVQTLVCDDIEAALTETARLTRTVNGLLALGRADTASGRSAAEVVSLDSVLDERVTAWSPVAADQGVTLTSQPGQLTVMATPDDVAQALDNLIANAIDASPTGGRVVLLTTPAGPPHQSAANSPPFVEVHVVDEGPGLSVKERTRAFDRFWRGRQVPSVLGGTGLGLAIARQYVRADGGDIELREAPTGGVDAVVLLPASKD